MEKGRRRVRIRELAPLEKPEQLLPTLNMEGAVDQGKHMISKKLERLGNGFSPRASRKDHNPADISMLTHQVPFWTSDFSNCKRRNLSYFKPVNL